MEVTKDVIARYGAYIGSGLLALGTTVFVLRRIFKPKNRICGKDYPKDMVIVHQFHKGRFAPSLGHFVVKLETYLRMAQIPYEPCFSGVFNWGPKKKIPWIEYNGITMGDSQLIIQFLNKEFNVDLNQHLSSKERATAWAIQKWLEEFTYWLDLHTKWNIYGDAFFKTTQIQIPFFMKPILSRQVVKMMYTAGVGRHSNEEIREMMTHDLRMLSELLGDQKFLMGDKPCELDCAAFGQLAQYRWHSPHICPHWQLLTEDLTNLIGYTDRMKDLYWSDWKDRITG